VSVCIANYNGEAMLVGCIDSILQQVGQVRVEILVHDDASTDASVELLKRYYPQTILIESARNVGFCAANNRMVARARGEYILLLNNDASLYPDALVTLVRGMRAEHDSAVLSLPQYDSETGLLVDLGMLLDPFHTPVPNYDSARTEVAYVIGACLFIPRARWQEFGGFPEWFESLAEDLYLCAVARLHGCTVRALNGSGYLHRQGASFGGNRIGDSGIQTTYRRRYLSERNRLCAMLITVPGPAAYLLASLQAMTLLIEGVSVSLVKRQAVPLRKIYWPAVRDTFVARREWRTLRRTVQHTRSVGLGNYLRVFTIVPYKLRMLLRHGVPQLH
jgi:GT2 family glycosyltransferase